MMDTMYVLLKSENIYVYIYVYVCMYVRTLQIQTNYHVWSNIVCIRQIWETLDVD